MSKHKKMNRVINPVGMVLFAIIIIGTAAASTVLESGIINASHAQTFQPLPSTGLEVTTTPGANPV